MTNPIRFEYGFLTWANTPTSPTDGGGVWAFHSPREDLHGEDDSLLEAFGAVGARGWSLFSNEETRFAGEDATHINQFKALARRYERTGATSRFTFERKSDAAE